MRVPAGAMTSRRLLFTVAGAGLTLFLVESGASSAAKAGWPGSDARAGGATNLSRADERLLDEVEQASFRYFWECADAQTGLVKDRSGADGPDAREAASIAATGFGLTRSEEHTSELQSLAYLVCRLLLEKKKKHICKLFLLKKKKQK